MFHTLTGYYRTALIHFTNMNFRWERRPDSKRQRESGEGFLYLNSDRGTWGFQILLSLGHQHCLVTCLDGGVATQRRMPLARRRLHGHCDRLSAVQAVCGAVDGTTKAIRGPQTASRMPALLVGILCGLCAALSCHRDKRLGGGARGHRRWSLLVTGRIWYRWIAQAKWEDEDKARQG